MGDSSIIGRIVITGDLTLKSPMLIGDGAGETADNFKDIHVLTSNGKPLIPGTSLAGVLRDYMKNVNPVMADKIFGYAEDNGGMQSAIQIDDIELDGKIINRDGVKIDSYTGIVDGDAKYDYEAVERGASGKLRMQVNLRQIHANDNINDAVAKILSKLESGIRIGALTTKGFGVAVTENLTADFYDFRNKNDVIAWLTNAPATTKILPAADNGIAGNDDLIVDADFKFNSSFIIRDYDNDERFEDRQVAISLKSRGDYVIPGTSLKGIFRHRAEYILDKLNVDKTLLNALMGTVDKDNKTKSKFIVAESYIKPANVEAIFHTRNKIDRFTGGVLQEKLFTTKPVYQKNIDTAVTHVHFEILNAEDYEVGLAMYLLRDMWIGNVAIGGEKSIGRGTVNGISAEINYKGNTYKLNANGKVIEGDSIELEIYAEAIRDWGGSR